LIKIQKTHSEVFFQGKKKSKKRVPKYLFKEKNRNSGNRKETWGWGGKRKIDYIFP
jgi:hypothetical protein